jgi:hypothetical protein
MIKQLFILFLLLPIVFAYDDNLFYIKDNSGPYEVKPGSVFNVDFVLVNQNLAGKNVSVSFDTCPVGWTCESDTYSYETDGPHNESLLITVPTTALSKKYTLHLKLSSEYFVTGGDDRVLVTVLSETQAAALSYDEYLTKKEQKVPQVNRSAALRLPEPKKLPETQPELKPAEYVEEEFVNLSVTQKVERLESDKHFVEYITFVLLIALILIGIGAYTSYKHRGSKK